VAPTNLLFRETGLPNIFWQRDKSMAIDFARFNDFLSANSRPSASPIESQIMWNYAHVRFRPEAISCRVTNECAFRLPSCFLVDAYGIQIQSQNSDSWISLLIASQLNTKTVHFWN
ncbi:hypothetical protein ALC56_13233, partial [Trachymyrmex septentrionalis]